LKINEKKGNELPRGSAQLVVKFQKRKIPNSKKEKTGQGHRGIKPEKDLSHVCMG
tara:strand:- start:1502 stop:1666 length:165 start_codon:yes stop_codon:yes gene_type:complete